MAKQAAAPGTCTICNSKLTKRTAAGHLLKEHANKDGRERFIILVDTPYSSPYWMVLLADPEAELSELDESLRDIWVECCSHLSAFTIMGVEYMGSPDSEGIDLENDSLSMGVEMQEVLSPGMTFRYEYDFGTTTELRLKVVDSILWDDEDDDVLMVVMNDKPEFICSECGKPAVNHYVEWEEEKVLCDECSEGEMLEECYLLPICNSPRTGLCGFEGGIFDNDSV